MFSVFVFCLCFVPLDVIAECELRVRVADYPPQYYIEDGQWKGMGIELVEVLLNEAGCKPVYQIQPWKRAIKSLEVGMLDIVMNLSVTDERKEFMHFIGPQRDESMILAVADNFDFKITSLEDIKKLPGEIGIQRGGFYGDTFKTKYESDITFKQKFYEVTNANQLIKMFQKKRLVGLIIDRYEFFQKVKTDKNFKGLKAHPFFINQDFIYFGLSKKTVSADTFERLQQAYKNAVKKGRFEDVLKQYRW